MIDTALLHGIRSLAARGPGETRYATCSGMAAAGWPIACAAMMTKVIEPAVVTELGTAGAQRFLKQVCVRFDGVDARGLPRPTFHVKPGLSLPDAWRQLRIVQARIGTDARRHDAGGLSLAHARILQNTKEARIRRSDARAACV
jgi:hypothetical protein